MNDSDITSGPRRVDRVPIERAVPRMLDQLPVIPARDDRHEESPAMPPAQKTGGELIAEKSIAVLDETANYVLAQIPPLRERLDRVEQMVIKASVDGRENIRAQVKIMEAASKVVQQIDQQISEAVKPLAALNNGVGRETGQ
jgi:hypothetical protein